MEERRIMARRQRYRRSMLAICPALIAIAATLAGCGVDRASRQHNYAYHDLQRIPNVGKAVCYNLLAKTYGYLATCKPAYEQEPLDGAGHNSRSPTALP